MPPVIQSAKAVLMVRPAYFGFNPETQDTNDYQSKGSLLPEEVYATALKEFENLKTALLDHGVAVRVFDNKDKGAPDAIFPNAVSIHPEGAVLYPMLQPNRQRELSPEFISFLTEELGYKIYHDFSGYAQEGRALEATASLVMDRINKVAYCALSARSDEALAREATQKLGYELITFETEDHVGKPVYHTDVLMFIGSSYAGICLDCITKGREKVEERLSRTHEIVPISPEQLLSMCGNALEVLGSGGRKFLVMSDKALAAFDMVQKEAFAKYTDGIIHAALSTLEEYGGGSARCMLMDLH